MATVKSKQTCKNSYEIKADIEACYEDHPCIDMVKFYKRIINIDVTPNVNIDESMTVFVKDSDQI